MPGIPAGVVAGSLIGIFGDQAGLSWRLMHVPLGLLCIVFGVMALKERLPEVSLSTDAPVTPGEMIKATLQNPTIFLWVVLMMFTASTEFAPGQWVDVALSQIVGMRGILLLAYVSGLMFVMRHFAGPLVKRLSNVGLLIFSAAFATVGLYGLEPGARPGQRADRRRPAGVSASAISGRPCWRPWPSVIRAAAPWCSG